MQDLPYRIGSAYGFAAWDTRCSPDVVGCWGAATNELMSIDDGASSERHTSLHCRSQLPSRLRWCSLAKAGTTTSFDCPDNLEAPTLVQASEIDGESDRNAVRDAFIAARRAGRSSVECYRAGVELWQRMHPEYALEYAALEAVGIILKLRFAELVNSALTETGVLR